MKIENIIAAQVEAERFLDTCDKLLNSTSEREGYLSGSALSGSVRRSSLDLTRALAEMRKSN